MSVGRFCTLGLLDVRPVSRSTSKRAWMGVCVPETRSGMSVEIVLEREDRSEYFSSTGSPERRQVSASVLTWPFLVFSSVLPRSEEHTSELQSQSNLVCRLLLE